MRVLLTLLLAFSLLACTEYHKKHTTTNSSASLTGSDDSLTFKPLKQDLYISRKGQLAFKMVDRTDPQKPIDYYQTAIQADTIDKQKEITLNHVIDTASFLNIGDLYYKDKNYVYYHFPMLHGGIFYIIWKADPETIEVLNNSYYAKDKNLVFCRGSILVAADCKTFKVMARNDKSVYKWSAKDNKRSYSGCD